MTGRTHDLAAFTALNLVIATQPVPQITLATALVAFTANMLGGLTPDIDQSTSGFWRKLRGGSLLSRLISPLFGGHRYLSHSIIGLILFSFLSFYILEFAKSFLLVDMKIVWWSFMIGFISHLIIDSITKEGVPWLFPIPFRFGFPPLSIFRIKTGGLFEKSFIFPGLILLNAFVIYTSYSHFLEIFRNIN